MESPPATPSFHDLDLDFDLDPIVPAGMSNNMLPDFDIDPILSPACETLAVDMDFDLEPVVDRPLPSPPSNISIAPVIDMSPLLDFDVTPINFPGALTCPGIIRFQH